jgi:hypothetical protein
MDKHDLTKLEAKIKDVAGTLSKLAGAGEAHDGPSGGLLGLIPIIHQPGWTTVADGIFVNGILDSIASHARTLSGLQATLIAGSHAVGQK